MSWDLLQRFLDSDVFNSDPFLSVSYLSRYADHIGIHHVLCNKLRQFPYEDIEFFLPQLCHLIISIDNESMALEEFLLDLCQESVTAALLTFWLFQGYLHDLAANPQTQAFQTCRRVYNKVQHIVFGLPDAHRSEKIAENVLPVTVLASFVLASIGLPQLPKVAGPLAIAQARRPAPVGEPNAVGGASDTEPVAPLRRPARAQTVTATLTKSRRARDASNVGGSTGNAGNAGNAASPALSLPPEIIRSPPPIEAAPKTRRKKRDGAPRPSSSGQVSAHKASVRSPDPAHRHSSLSTAMAMANLSLDARLSTASLPLPSPSPHLAATRPATRPATPVLAGMPSDPSASAQAALNRRHSHQTKTRPRVASVGDMTAEQKVRLLRQNYFRCQTQFLRALEDISNRLVGVPKPARLSALRAELALIGQDLPAEVDIPIICPPTLVDGAPSRSRHHRIVRLSPAEATVLNSAEKVPYLLMVEVLREDFTFDADTPDNQRLLAQLVSDPGSRRRIFDLSDSARPATPRTSDVAAFVAGEADSVFEPASGDLGHSPLMKPLDDDAAMVARGGPRRVASLGSGMAAAVASAEQTEQTFQQTFPSSPSSLPGSTPGSTPAPLLRKMTMPIVRGASAADQPDFSALATHMRTAAQMLAQLEATSGKRPRHEVAAIRAKIIASMQSLEEQSFDIDDGGTGGTGPTFDTIMAKAPLADAAGAAGASSTGSSTTLAGGDDHVDAATAGTPPPDVDVAVDPHAGIARMENDFKTGGLQRKGDRDDPSAAVFGEAWDVKRERIRRSSPYGWMKNWDLVSVIVKTGADLRQEAFACQLIAVCDRIWQAAAVPVWVKQMRILVSGESSGLIETITNGVSLHSIKRSLTLASVEAGTNPRGRIATLKDYFVKAFGAPTTDAHRAGVDAFKRSLAAYSILSYVLQLKDRHNGNVLVDSEGHIVHIDFGFMLSNSPGSVAFEAAPFKLTHEYVEVLGGVGSRDFDDYKRLCKQAFQALRRSADSVVDLVSMVGRDSTMPCFASGGPQAAAHLRQRFQLHLSAEDAEQFVETELVGKSLGSYYTRLYDTFQYRTQGIY